jgi:hypothetical protein
MDIANFNCIKFVIFSENSAPDSGGFRSAPFPYYPVTLETSTADPYLPQSKMHN